MVTLKSKFNKKIGTVVGLGRQWNELKIVVSFSQRLESPFSGEFLIVEEQEGKKRKLLCLVEDPVYGDYATTSDYREKTLVEKYLRELENITTPLSEEEKKSLFFRCYYIRVIGEIFQNSSGNYQIKSVYRFLPELTSVCRYPDEEEYKAIVNAGINASEDNMLYIGNLAIGDDVCEDLKIGIEKSKILYVERNDNGIVEKTNGKRTAILARTGYGKSNLCKVLLLSLISKTDFPVLICDLNGEYAFSSAQGKGFLDIPGVKNKVIVYTEKQDLINNYPYNCFPLNIDFKCLNGRDVATLISFKETETVGIKQLRGISNEEWEKIVIAYENSQDQYISKKEAIEKELVDIFVSRSSKSSSTSTANKPSQEIRALSWRLLDVLDTWHDSEGRLIIDEVFFLLTNGFTVIFDFSLKDTMSSLAFMSFLTDKILQNNIKAFTGQRDKIIPCILVIEEAQNVLNSQIKEEGKDIFIKIAKEGRKFGISLIYITQQPGSIDESILSQTDNFFVMHLLNEQDIKALQKANFHYSGCVANFLKNEALVGNVYIYSAPYQPYVFPAKVFDFEDLSNNMFATLNVKTLKEIVDKAQQKLKNQTILYSVTDAGNNYKYIKIGKLQYLWKELISYLHPCCFESDKLKYNYTKAILKFMSNQLTIKTLTMQDGSKKECWIPDDEAINNLCLRACTL